MAKGYDIDAVVRSNQEAYGPLAAVCELFMNGGTYHDERDVFSRMLGMQSALMLLAIAMHKAANADIDTFIEFIEDLWEDYESNQATLN